MTTPETFIHEFPATPILPAYKALAIRQGFNAVPVLVYKGRRCYLSGSVRTRVKKGWRFFNVCIVRFLDDNTAEHVPEAQFNKLAKYAPLD